MAISTAITPYTGSTSTAIVKPQQSLSGIVPVPVEKNTETVVVTVKDIRTSVLKLLRKRQQRDRLEQKFYNLQDTLDKRKKAEKEEGKSKKGILGKLGSGIAGKAKAVGGDLFDAVGKLLGFIALDWISKPENQQIVQAIVEGIGQIFKFIDWFVTGSVDNLLSGFTSLVAGDTLLERFVGFFQMAAGFMGLKYFLNPTSIVTDLTKAIKFIKGNGPRKIKIFLKKVDKFGLKKGLKFAFPRITKVLQTIGGLGSKILSGIKGILGKSGGSLFSKIGQAIMRVAGKLPVKTLLGPVKQLIKPVAGFLKRIPVVGGLISFGLNLLLGDSLDQAAFKGLGAALGTWIGGGLGSLIPIPVLGTFAGTFVGGMVGEWLGNRFYEMLMKKPPTKPTKAEEQKAAVLKAELKLKNKMGDNYENLSQAQIDKLVADNLDITPEEVKKRREAKTGPDTDDDESDKNGGANTSTGNGGGSFSTEITDDEKAALGVLAKYESGAAGYDAVNQGGGAGGRTVLGYSGNIKGMPQHNGRSLTDFTIGEIKQLQSDDGSMSMDQWNKAGKLHAVGRYQFVGNTLPGVASRAGFGDDNKFNKTVQDKMAIQLIKERGISPWVGPSDKATNAERQLVSKVRSQGGKGDGKPSRSQIPTQSKGGKSSILNLGTGDGNSSRSQMPTQSSSVAPIPKQSGSDRSSMMKDVSTNVIQTKMIMSMRRKGSTTIVINKAGSQVINNQTTSTPVGLNNSNKPQSVKRGI